MTAYNQRRVKHLFATRIAIAMDIYNISAYDDTITEQIQKITKKNIWRTYDKIELLSKSFVQNALSYHSYEKVISEIFQNYIGVILGELRELRVEIELSELIRKFIWSIFDDLRYMNDILVW